MKEKETIKSILQTKRNADKRWYLSLLDEAEQTAYEQEHIRAVLVALKVFYLGKYQRRIAEAKEEIAALRARENYGAEEYRAILALNAEIAALTKKMAGYKCFFSEPYFARMDAIDNIEGYNVYYIGKKGDPNLEIVDWRAPLAVRYYQKSRVNFAINEYEYRTVLRRALSVKNGKLQEFRNEYLSVGDVLTREEIAGRDEEILFDPYLRSIIRSRKDDVHVRDIIRTIQEKQFEIITRPERESFVLQGCAGSGKTMILLHRLSYLMYNNDALRPRDVLVITPSDSFNDFIDDLSQVLELQKVYTVTLRNYFFRALMGEGIDLAAHLTGEREREEYLSFLYSDRFPEEVRGRIAKIYDGICGLFTGDECRQIAGDILEACTKRREGYVCIKNASTRIRRAVLGEMKEAKEGGFYFTKPFRALMSAFLQVEEFLRYVLEGGVRSPDDFFRGFVEFYRSAQFAASRAEQIFGEATEDLAALSGTIEKEIADLRRYRTRKGTQEIYTYAERIGRREELLREAGKISARIQGMGEGLALFKEFCGVLRLTGSCAELGKCKSAVDIARWLYRETVKKYKKKYGMQGVYPSDGYALSLVLTLAGRKLLPRYGLVFIDEGQDISAGEYALLRRIHSDAAFAVFGDLRQNITPWRGIGNWEELGLPVYTLNQNYRNTNEIVDFVSAGAEISMLPIGLHGAPVKRLKPRSVTAFFRDKQGLKAVIAKEEYLPRFEKRGYRVLSAMGKVSRTKINVMSVYESKGLEFSTVAVYDKGMTENEKYIAYTRALRELAVIED